MEQKTKDVMEKISEWHPPRVFLEIHVDGDFSPYVRIQSEGNLRDWFGDPMHGKVKPGQTYLSESEHQSLRAADLLEVERLKIALEAANQRNVNQAFTILEYDKQVADLRLMNKNCEEAIFNLSTQRSQEREARKGDSAERLEKLLNLSIQEKCHYREECEKADEKNAGLIAALEDIYSNEGEYTPAGILAKEVLTKVKND